MNRQPWKIVGYRGWTGPDQRSSIDCSPSTVRQTHPSEDYDESASHTLSTVVGRILVILKELLVCGLHSVSLQISAIWRSRGVRDNPLDARAPWLCNCHFCLFLFARLRAKGCIEVHGLGMTDMPGSFMQPGRRHLLADFAAEYRFKDEVWHLATEADERERLQSRFGTDGTDLHDSMPLRC